MPEDEAAPPPCAGCRALRRRCVPGCVFAPYFPADGGDGPSRFAAVHRVFGASNVARMLEDVPAHPSEERRRAAETLVQEALARERDPALGLVSYVTVLQMLNDKAREQVDAVRAEIAAEFGAGAASEPVDLAAADPAAKTEARAQAERAMAHARAQDSKLLAARQAVDVKWHQQRHAASEHAGERPRVPGARMPETEKTVAVEESSGEKARLTPQAAAVMELDFPEGNVQMAETQHAGAEPGIPEGYGSEHPNQPGLDAALPHRPQDMVMQTAEAQQEAAAAEDQELMQMLLRYFAAAGEGAAEQDVKMPPPATGAPQFGSLAARYAGTELDAVRVQQMVPAQQLAAAANVAGEQDVVHLIATEELTREQRIMIAQQVAAAAFAGEQEMTMLLQAAAALQQDPMAQYTETELGVSPGQGHPYMLQLPDALRVAREANTTTPMQQVAAYTNAEHGSDSGATVAFRQQELAEAAPFLVEQQPPPLEQTARALGLQTDSPPLPSLGQPHGQVSQQQSRDGGAEGQSSDLMAYLYY